MAVSFKKILLTGTALVAVAFVSQAQAATVTINGADQAVAVDPAATPAITFTTDHVATVADDVNLTGTVTAGTTNFGTLTFSGTSTVSGAVGVNAGNVIKLINSGATGEVVTFSSSVDATTLTGGAGTTTITGKMSVVTVNAGTGIINVNNVATNVGNVSFAANDGTVNFGAGAVKLTGSIDATTASTGTVTFLGSNEISGTIGATAAVKVLNGGANATTSKVAGVVKATTTNITGTGALELNGAGTNISNAIFAADGKLTIGNGGSLTGNVTTTAGTNTGTLLVKGGTLTGNAGATGAILKLVELGESATTSVTGTIFATKVDVKGANAVALGGTVTSALNFGADGTVTVADDANITGAVTTGTTNTGTLILAGTTTVSGAVGVNAGNIMKEVKAGATGDVATFSSTLDTTLLTVTGTGTVALNGDTGAATLAFGANDGVVNVASGKNLTVTNVTNNASTGTLNFLGGTQAVAGTIGAANKVKAITSGATSATTTFGGAIRAVTITSGAGTSTFTGLLTAVDTLNVGTGTVNINNVGTNVATAISFAGNDGTLSFGAGAVKLTGAIDATTASKGTVTFLGSNEVSGAIGTTAAVKVLNAGANATTSKVAGVVKATTTNITGTGALELNGAGTNISNAIFAADGKLTIGNGGSLTGNVTTTAGTNTGTLVVAGGTVTGTVGATGAVLKSLEAGASGATVVTGNVFATETEIKGANTVGFSGDLNGILDMNNNAATVTIASGKNLNGSVASTGGTNGTLAFAGGTQAVSGAVAGLATLNAGQAGGTTTFNSTVAATTTNVGTGTVAFSGGNVTGALAFGGNDGTATIGATRTLSGAVSTTTNGTGTLTYLGASANGASTIGANALRLKALTLAGGNVTTSSNVFAADTTTLGTNKLTTGGTFNLGAAQNLAVTIGAPTTIGNVDAGANVATVNTNAVVTITIADGVNITTGQTFTVINGTGGGVVADLAAGKIVENAALYTFAQVTANDDDLVIQATRVAASTVVTAGNSVTAGATLENAALTGSGDAQMILIQSNYAATTTSTIDSFLSSVSPTVDGGAQVAALDTNVAVQGLTETRLAALRSGETGVAAGASGTDSLWFQLFGQIAEQDVRGGIAGYDSATIGGVVGVDTQKYSDKTTLGVALSYGNTSVESENANTTDTDVDSFGLNLYGNRDLGGGFFGSAQVGYAYNAVDSVRHNVGGAGINASADYNSNQYSAKAVVGSDYAIDQGLVVTPSVSAAYTFLDTDGYTETGAGGGNLIVQDNTASILDLGVGVNAAWMFNVSDDGTVVKPSVHAGYTYDAIGDRVETTSTFTAGGPAFNTNGAEPARGKANVGAGVTVVTTENWDLTAKYDYTAKEDYGAHGGYLRASTHF